VYLYFLQEAVDYMHRRMSTRDNLAARGQS